MNTSATFALLGSLLIAGAAHAAGNPGTSSVNDVKLGTDAADQFVLIQGQQINPIQSTAGFAAQFVAISGTAATGWTLAETIDYSHNALVFNDKVIGDNLNFSLSQNTGRTSGTWSITNTSLSKNQTLDLALSFHAGNNVGSFLFNDQAVAAGQTLTGSWSINWLNSANKNSIPMFSNVGVYTGSIAQISAVPEPGSYAMLLGGLGLVGFAARRRRAK